MIKRIVNSKLPLLVYNPTKVYDLNYFITLSQAGALPVLDTEFFTTDEVMGFIDELYQSKILFGIRIFCHDSEIIEFLNKNNIDNLDLIVISYFNTKELDSIALTNTFYKCIIEVTDINITGKLDLFMPHGLILKGNEAPGKVSRLSSFMLMQWYLENTSYSIFIHGGVGIHTAAGMFAAGVCGVVLDNQLYLTDEAPIGNSVKTIIQNINEKDTIVLNETSTCQFRFFSKLATKITKVFKEEINTILFDNTSKIHDNINKRYAFINQETNPSEVLFYLGQDAYFAHSFIKESKSITSVINRFYRFIGESLSLIDEFDSMVSDSPLAKLHHTKFPIVQGPMVNISDNAEFAEIIYNNGALPFFGCGNLPVHLVDSMLKEGCNKVKNSGVGLIGVETFSDIFKEHVSLAIKHKVKYAIIAGGKPEQAHLLESNNIKTYIHTPSLSLFKNAIKQNVNSFVLEGSEAGGHVGDLYSCVLWENIIEEILSMPKDKLENLSILFAGGISSKTASYFISGISARLCKLKVKIGISVGTAYLMTNEIINCNAVATTYQSLLLKETETHLVGRTVNMTTRTLKTPFTHKIIQNEHERLNQKISIDKRKEEYELDNFGAHLLASKGKKIIKDTKELIQISADEQIDGGNYCSGDGIILFNKPFTIEVLHNSLFNSKKELFINLNQLECFSDYSNQINDEIAIIGMGCLFPDSDNLETYWENIISKKYSISKVPKERFDIEPFFDINRNVIDTCYTNLAATLKDYKFDHAKFNYTDEEASVISRGQKIILETAFKAVAHAGYLNDKHLDNARTQVIVADCTGPEINDRHFKFLFPEIKNILQNINEFDSLTIHQKDSLLKDIESQMNYAHIDSHLENTLNNIEASRIAKHLNLHGKTYATDAACASSLIAIDCAIKDLLSNISDYAIVGGVNTNISPEIYVGFAKMGALSDTGSYPFDERSNGFCMGEGAGAIILKRMKDAIRDNDTIYCTIKAIGTSSDGNGKAVAAPNPKGQALAIKRCFDKIKTPCTFDDIDYIEAHGTSTLAGDAAEIQTLQDVYKVNTPIGISSVKSQIGHLMGGAGIAGIIKATLAINNQVLPPNGQFNKVSSKINLNAPFYIIDNAKPWHTNSTRKAAVSSFGFGGINTHVILEEYTQAYIKQKRQIFADTSYDFNQDRIVVVGTGCILPGASNTEIFWNNMITNKNSIDIIPSNRINHSYQSDNSFYTLPTLQSGTVKEFTFNSIKYKVPPTAIKVIDKSQLFAVEAAAQAIEEADIKSKLTYGNKIGVIIGNMMSGETLYEHGIRCRIPILQNAINNNTNIDQTSKEALKKILTDTLRERFVPTNEDTFPGFIATLISGRVANYFNCNGINFIVDSASTSSAIAISNAITSLKQHDLDYVITGGVDSNLTPSVLHGFKTWGILSEHNKPFSLDAKGFCLGEGSALFVLTTYKNAVTNKQNILAEIDNLSFFSDPANSITTPNQKSYQQAQKNLYHSLPITPSQINYLEVNGSSNVLLDSIEQQSIDNTFKHPLRWGSLKPNIGYLKSANPAVVLLKHILMNKNKTLLGNGLTSNSTILLDNKSNITLGKENNRNFASNFFGIGGNHVHAVVHNIPFWLNANTSKKNIEFKKLINTHQAKKVQVVALFTGQGSQYVGMMHELYKTTAEIRDVFDWGEKLYKTINGFSLLEILFNDEEKLKQTEFTQPTVFLTSVALFTYLKKRHFNPDLFIGHSLGELSALFCAGLLDFETAFKLVVKRAELMKIGASKNPGTMLAVLKNAVDTDALIKQSSIPEVYLANKNSNTQTVVSGSNKGIKDFTTYLKQLEISFVSINVSTAFHSPFFKETALLFREYLNEVSINTVNAGAVISNVTGCPYPQNSDAIKDLLAEQLFSSVEFVKSIQKNVITNHCHLIEIGPGKILTNLIKNITIDCLSINYCIEKNKDEVKSLASLVNTLDNLKITQSNIENVLISKPLSTMESANSEKDQFDGFLHSIKEKMDFLLQDEFNKYKKEALKKFNFYTDDIVISGVSIGLPGSQRKVFDEHNFDNIIEGVNFIESLSNEDKAKMLNKNITRLDKDAAGNASFKEVQNSDDVIQLASKLGYFNLQDYGINYSYDITYELGIIAGYEALKDANIPLVKHYRKLPNDKYLDEGFALPLEMQKTTGVIFASAFPGFESIIDELTLFYTNKFVKQPFNEFEKIYFYLMENITDYEIKRSISNWFADLNIQSRDIKSYQFNRELLFNITSLGSAHFAQLIKAKGPNMQINAACATTTHAIGIAEDWLRSNRCDRVIIIGGEAPTSDTLNEWIGSGMLALGAATTEKNIEMAALPFDARRNGLILGSGAVSIIVEKETEVKKRGLNGQATILGTYIGNSSYHVSRIDVDYVAEEVNHFITKVENQYDLDKTDYAKKLIFMSHETYTPAKGGSSESEVKALQHAFPNNYKEITITNTKGYTGHTLGAGIEDAVMIKALQQYKAPAIANLKEIPDSYKDLIFSDGQTKDLQYGIHFAAGFGSHFSLLFVKRLQEKSIDKNITYSNWLKQVSLSESPQLEIINNILCAVAEDKLIIKKEVEHEVIIAPELKEQLQNKNKPVISTPNNGSINNTIKGIISELTGYTVDLLEDTLDLEADLGIDTVKQVEIFGKISSKFQLPVPEDLKLSKYNTIEKLKDYVDSRIDSITQQTDNKEIEIHADNEMKLTAVSQVKDNNTALGIKEIIAELTGYSVDLLEDTLDLEADLGIDTVKQVEIFGKICSKNNIAIPEDLKLSQYNTIYKLTEFIHSKNKTILQKEEIKKAVDVPVNAILKPNNPSNESTIKRHIIRVKEMPLPENLYTVFPNGTYLVTKDLFGFADILKAQIENENIKVITIGKANADLIINFDDPSLIESQWNSINPSFNNLQGLIHLAAIDGYIQNELNSITCINKSIKSFFSLIKLVHDKLNQPGKILATLTFDSVIFPYDTSVDVNIHPTFAGIAGMYKTIKKEWPNTLVKVVDFNSFNILEAKENIIQTFLAEIKSGDTTVETGYRDNKKYILSYDEHSIEKGASFINHGATILVTGGGRGITYEICKQLVKDYKVNLIIIGQSRYDDIDAELLSDQLSEDDIFKMQQLTMINAKPLEIKKSVEQILKKKTIRDNIEFLKSLGAEIQYEAVDIADFSALRTTLKKYKQIDGVIHGAGVNENNYIPKKDLVSFNRVFDSKVIGGLNLIKLTNQYNLKFFVAFSSIAAKTGNDAQIDYASANDMLGKIIQRESLINTEIIYKIFDWTAWKDTGMANNETVKKVLQQKGIESLEIANGVEFFINELNDINEKEIIISSLGNQSKDQNLMNEINIFSNDSTSNYIFIDSEIEKDNNNAIFNRIISIEKDLYLKDHMKDGIPIFPGAFGLEVFAQASTRLINNSKLFLTKITDFEIPYGIKLLKQQPKEIFISVSQNEKDIVNGLIWSKTPNLNKENSIKKHYNGICHFNTQQNKSSSIINLPERNISFEKLKINELLYHPERLFVGQTFYSIQDVISYNDQTLVCKLGNIYKENLFEVKGCKFIINPIEIDAMFQTVGVLEFFNTNQILLPYKIDELSFYHNSSSSNEYFCVTTKIGENEKTADYSIKLLNDKYEVITIMNKATLIKVHKTPMEYRVTNKFKFMTLV